MKSEPSHATETLSRIVAAADVPTGGRRVRVEATPDECTGLAAALGIPSVESLVAELELRPVAGDAVSVAGRLEAAVTQTDVVTLEPVRQQVSEAIDLVLSPAEPPLRQGRALPAVEADDEADTFANGRIDVGAIVREHLALGLDPYPRAPETTFQPHVEDAPERDPSPFAKLVTLVRSEPE